jgi:hypothetical protein
MTTLPRTWLALLGSLAIGAASAAFAQDNRALFDLLVKKGTLTDQEAEDLRSEISKQNTAALVSTGLGANLEKITITGRFQSQFVGLASDTNSTVANPAATQHFLLRRIYLGFRPQFANNWSAYVNLDFANASFDQATISWKQSDAFTLDVGLRKVPLGYDEWSISSGALKSMERSAATRFFVEGNNGRRLGAGSYRMGAFVGGASSDPAGGWSYNLAVTNPERDESYAGVASAGASFNNNLAYWANLGYNRKFGEGLLNSWKVGVSAGYLPDQGGAGLTAAGAVIPSPANLGKGLDLNVYSVYTDLYYDKFSLVGEYYGGNVERGRLGGTATTGLDAKPSGWWIQPSYRVGQYELVARFDHLDSDGRGIQPGDLVRSAPSPAGITMNTFDAWFVGLNWYILGNDLKHDLKLQFGWTSATTKDRLAPAVSPVSKITTEGFRTELQINF